jgi:hypothetical protein
MLVSFSLTTLHTLEHEIIPSNLLQYAMFNVFYWTQTQKAKIDELLVGKKVASCFPCASRASSAAEFLNVIGTKFFRVFVLAIHCHLY